ncbi:hypothetical protein BHU72_14965 [Desulfuribacillus stibiiarsenatis]|uniref:Uncharacterized protein n=1 Tax=Desulfuribacillus stibiiarsenatis TaxID=1390249 RepID=A0A1E5L746_9FIRM|nr:hypothetical protein [Desulfuribacillus stibiiarsenatis]OEH85980.1 hypothetical protein BHU72_14965 [Desulfuribacillus stibiiarsenatis]
MVASTRKINKLKSNVEKQIKEALTASGINISDKKIVREFMLVEGFLHFCYRNGYIHKTEKLYALLLNLHKLANTELGSIYYQLDNLRYSYYLISSKTYYNAVLRRYLKTPTHTRIYDVSNNRLITSEECGDLNIIDRIEYYNRLIEDQPDSEDTDLYINQSIRNYKFYNNNVEFNVSLEEIDLPTVQIKLERNKKGGSFTITIDELYQAAKEMDNLIEERIFNNIDIKKQNYLDRLHKVRVDAVQSGQITDTTEITIDKVCNMLGMVGAGKSTIMQILAFYAAKQGYRLCIVFETVKEELDTNYLLQQLGIKCTPVKGETTIYDQIEKVIENDEMIIHEKYASHLTGVCTLDGFIGRTDNIAAIEYGKEPCFKLRTNSGNKKYVCPFYWECPRRQDTRDIQDADVIVTNIYSLTTSNSHYIKKFGRISILEYIIKYIDIVIFDEADKLQVVLDKKFCSTTEITKILSSNKNQFVEEVDKSIAGPAASEAIAFTKEYAFMLQHLNTIRAFITDNKTINKLDIIQSGKWFTGQRITNEFFNERHFSASLKNDLINYNINDEHIELFAAYENEFLVNFEVENTIQQIIDKYKLNTKQQLLFEFTMSLILFEKSLYKLSNLLMRLADISGTALDVPDIFKAPYRKLMRLIPTSPLGNIFGYIYDQDQKDIKIFRKSGIGRSIMLDLPYMRIDDKGSPLGPNILLLSGSSWAEGSNRYHICKPVNYILKPRDEILKFIENTEVNIISSRINVSGNQDRFSAIRDLLIESVQYIKSQLQHSNRILFIVNSYEQCKVAQQTLQDLLPSRVIYRLVSDKSCNEQGTIQRGKLNEARNLDFEILIAPASAIERGHNIVDECGHSLFSALFYLVRPMDVPRDIENIVSNLNGAVYEYAHKKHYTNVYTHLQELTEYANSVWIEEFENYYSIANYPKRRKEEIVVSRLVLIVQIYGRLLRITDLDRIPPKLFFLDGAFTANEINDFDLLKEIEEYLDKNINRKDVGVIVERLYGAFYKALKRGNVNVQNN